MELEGLKLGAQLVAPEHGARSYFFAVAASAWAFFLSLLRLAPASIASLPLPASRISSSGSLRSTSSQIARLPLSPRRFQAYQPLPSPSHRQPPSLTTRV